MTPTQILILRDLAFGPATCSDLTKVVRINIRNVRVAVNKLKALGKVHICAWETCQRPVWAKGLRWDADRPPPQAKNEKHMKYRKNHEPQYRAAQRRYRLRNKDKRKEKERERRAAKKRLADQSKYRAFLLNLEYMP